MLCIINITSKKLFVKKYKQKKSEMEINFDRGGILPKKKSKLLVSRQ